MNPFRVLNIEPTTDKMRIRRAYVKMAKTCHPDGGGDPLQFYAVKEAYEALIAGNYRPETIETNVELGLKELLTGCIASAIITINDKAVLVEFDVPANTYPGTRIEFADHSVYDGKISVKLANESGTDYKLLNQHVLIQREINKFEAQRGIVLKVKNFDGKIHYISVPENTTATKLVYEIENEGFFDKTTKIRGNLTVLVNINKKVN